MIGFRVALVLVGKGEGPLSGFVHVEAGKEVGYLQQLFFMEISPRLPCCVTIHFTHTMIYYTTLFHSRIYYNMYLSKVSWKNTKIR